MAFEVKDDREAPAVDTRTVLVIVASFVLFVAFVMAGFAGYMRFAVVTDRIDQPLGTFPVPQIQPDPTQDYLGFRARQNEELAGYAWVDRDRNLIHIPIARAMSLVARKGAAAYDPPDQAAAAAEAVAGQPPDGAPRAVPSLPAGPYGARP
ncbi:MAG TPA: hypothetical protein VH414_05710 [Lichenihabitans sp.]|jgi:hypothetical protein|nr:hypothetical protein [Lichenihabitans sp.]